MKRVKLAIAILIIIPALIFATHIYIKNITTSMSAKLDSAETLAERGNKTQAEKQLTDFDNAWNANKGLMATFIRHSELDTVNLSAAKLGPYLEGNNVDEFCAESESLRYQLRHIWETEKFSIDNVL